MKNLPNNFTFRLVASNLLSLVGTVIVVLLLVDQHVAGEARRGLLGQGGGGGETCCVCSPPHRLVDHNVSLANIVGHLETLQEIADSAGGSREAGSKGFDDSTEYVKEQLTQAGYNVEVQTFDTLYDCGYECCGTMSTADKQFDYSADFYETWCSPFASAEANTTFVGNGCRDLDFVEFESGNIAIVERSNSCSIDKQVVTAQSAGASGIVIFDDEARASLSVYTLKIASKIPVFIASYSAGQELIQNTGLLSVNSTSSIETIEMQTNIIAEKYDSDNPPSDDQLVVMAGCHLDSVQWGPGINDNGSGSATILEIALQMPASTKYRVRFAFWGAEELETGGSYYYVAKAQELEDIAVYLNFDMIGSPNFNRMYYIPVSAAEELIVETVWIPFFQSRSLSVIPFDIEGRSDHYPFQLAGVPTGGLFSGSDEVKTEEEAALFGGVAGMDMDPCYHDFCDTFDNMNLQVLEELSDAAAQAVLTLVNRDNSDLMQNRNTPTRH